MPQFGLQDLRREVDVALHNALKVSTKLSYNSCVRNFARFCILHGIDPILVVHEKLAYNSDREVEEVMALFATWLVRTTKVGSADHNLSAVSTWTPHMGLRPMYRLDYFPQVMRGLRRVHFSPPNRKQPVTAEHLTSIFDWAALYDFDTFNIATVFSVAFHGLCHKSEVMMRDQARGFQADVDLTWEKVIFHPNAIEPEYVEIYLGICKGDQKKPTRVYLYRSRNKKTCPVRTLHTLFWWPKASRKSSDPVFT